jgi:hypothetical protein
MKTRFSKKDILIVILYLVICAIIGIIWDVKYALNLQFSSSMLAGILTIAGGALVAYWFWEREKLKREHERETEQTRLERARIERIIKELTAFKRFLLPWIFDFACAISGHFLNYDENKIYNEQYRNDIPELEDIFGIGSFDSTGRRLRGTEKADAILNAIFENPITPQMLYQHLRYGLRSLKHVEERIRIFPSLVEEVTPEVATIILLSDAIDSRIDELQFWEKKQELKRVSPTEFAIDTAMKSNLMSVGRSALNVVIAINENIGTLESRIRD